MFLFLFLFFFALLLYMLIFQIKELFQVKNGLTTSLLLFFFFLKMPKIWAGRTTLNGIKKEDGLKCYVNTGLPEFYFHCSRLECIDNE